jgi:hypothetical protein
MSWWQREEDGGIDVVPVWRNEAAAARPLRRHTCPTVDDGETKWWLR